MRVPRIIAQFVLCVACYASASDLRQIGMVNLPGAPGFGQAAFCNGMLLLTQPGASAVDVFDPVRRRVVAQITGLQSPRAIAVDEKSGRVYLADHGSNAIAVVATDGWKVIDSIALPGSPDALLLAGDGKLYWADADAETLSLLDLRTKQDVAETALGGRPRDLAFDRSRQLLFATLQDAHQIVAVASGLSTSPAPVPGGTSQSPTSAAVGPGGVSAAGSSASPAVGASGTNAAPLTVVNRFTLSASQPTGLIYDPQYHELYVAVRYAVLAISADTGAEIDRVAAPAGVDSLWLDPDSRTLFAASEGSLLVMQAKGRLTQVDELATAGVKGRLVAYDADKHMVLIPGGSEGKSKLLILRPMTANAQPDDSDARVR